MDTPESGINPADAPEIRIAKLQLFHRIQLLERMKRAGCPRIALFNQESLIRDARIASGEYKAISGDPSQSGSELAGV